VQRELEALLGGPLREELRRLMEPVAQAKVDGLEIELAGFDLGDIQDVIQQPSNDWPAPSTIRR
jgi:hypothetical protein